MKMKIMIIGLFCFLAGNSVIAQKGNADLENSGKPATEEVKGNNGKGNAYGKAKSLENRVNSMESKIERAKLKLVEHREKGTMPIEEIEKKEQQIRDLEAKLKDQKSGLATVINTPKPGKSDKGEKGNKPEKGEKPNKGNKPEKGEKPEKPEKGNKPEKAEKPNKGNKPAKPNKGKKDDEGHDHDDDMEEDEDDGHGKPDKPGKPDKAGKPNKGKKPH